MLRSHQTTALNIARLPECGVTIKTILASVAPGGGKSALPPIFARELMNRHLADKVAWISPRLSLSRHGEQSFAEPWLRTLIGHDLEIRAAGNEPDPSRGTAGYATTYQAVGVDPTLHADEFRRHRYILVLDEVHHVDEGGKWHKALQPLVDRAVLVILLTGTLERGDRKPIAFVPYGEDGRVVMGDNEHTKVIQYSWVDGLREKALIPLSFTLQDGTAEWKDGELECSVERLSTSGDAVNAALYTALMSDNFARPLLEKAVDHWRSHRQVAYAKARLLVVAHNISAAKKYLRWLREMGVTSAGIAVSRDDDNNSDALRNIERFKGKEQPHLDALVTVAMAYEGLDCRAITHIACLTHFRSKPWIEQMLARATRFNPDAGGWEGQHAFVWAPDDPLFKRCIDEIRAAQAAAVVEMNETAGQHAEADRSVATMIVPLASEATGMRARGLDQENAIAGEQYELMELLARETGLHGVVPLPKLFAFAQRVQADMGQREQPNQPQQDHQQQNQHQPARLTVSQRENNYRRAIEVHVRKVCCGDATQIKEMNATIWRLYRKPRASMTEAELKRVIDERQLWSGRG